MDIVIGCWISEPKQLLTSHVCSSVAAILRAKLTNAVDADTFFLLSVADHFSCQQLQLANILFLQGVRRGTFLVLSVQEGSCLVSRLSDNSWKQLLESTAETAWGLVGDGAVS